MVARTTHLMLARTCRKAGGVVPVKAHLLELRDMLQAKGLPKGTKLSDAYWRAQQGERCPTKGEFCLATPPMHSHTNKVCKKIKFPLHNWAK
jgi:hypothetical protein